MCARKGISRASPPICQLVAKKFKHCHPLATFNVRPLSSGAAPLLTPPPPHNLEVTLSSLVNRQTYKQKKIVGRGIGSGRGKTCGSGHKGQKSRAGAVGGSLGGSFEGGQTPIYRRLPKRGFTNRRAAKPLSPISVEQIYDFVQMGRLDAKHPITMKELYDAGVTKSIKFGVKLVAPKVGFMAPEDMPLTIEVTRASGSAIALVESIGGSVTSAYYNRLGLRVLLKPHKFEGKYVPRRAGPRGKKALYYSKMENRGYLAPEMQLRAQGIVL